MFISSPLEQFEIVPIISSRVGNVDLSFTNSSYLMLINLLFVAFLFRQITLYGKGSLIPARIQTIFESIYEVVLGMASDNIGARGQKFFPFVFVLFLFLLVANLLGMIPYSFTVTSHIIVTFALALTVFLAVNIVGFREHGIEFFGLFLPPGAPFAMAPFLVLIELVSYNFRVVSLSVRLFANMMSGHMLLKILAGFGWTMLTAGGFVMVILHFFPRAVVFLLIGLEMVVAMIQAYVFSILTCIYLSDAINLH